MAREFRILHHRQVYTGGHWDLVENPVLSRSAAADAPQGDGSLCGALEHLAEQGWNPVLELHPTSTQSGECHILLTRGS